MQSFQSNITLPKQITAKYPPDNMNEQDVEDFLNQCRLAQYLPIFLDEGFDSITSVSRYKRNVNIFTNFL
jgi:hypothetical protein